MIAKKLITRYQELKQEVPDCILLMQVGAFMQTMNDDAQAVSKITHFKLQMAGEVNAPVIVGGFPLSGMDKSIGKLLRAGHSIAIAMQDENKERHITEIIRVQCQRFS